ncbi:hypothetical protein N2152v2_003369 [Parachlorella kessleri]
MDDASPAPSLDIGLYAAGPPNGSAPLANLAHALQLPWIVPAPPAVVLMPAVNTAGLAGPRQPQMLPGPPAAPLFGFQTPKARAPMISSHGTHRPMGSSDSLASEAASALSAQHRRAEHQRAQQQMYQLAAELGLVLPGPSTPGPAGLPLAESNGLSVPPTVHQQDYILPLKPPCIMATPPVAPATPDMVLPVMMAAGPQPPHQAQDQPCLQAADWGHQGASPATGVVGTPAALQQYGPALTTPAASAAAPRQQGHGAATSAAVSGLTMQHGPAVAQPAGIPEAQEQQGLSAAQMVAVPGAHRLTKQVLPPREAVHISKTREEPARSQPAAFPAFYEQTAKQSSLHGLSLEQAQQHQQQQQMQALQQKWAEQHRQQLRVQISEREQQARLTRVPLPGQKQAQHDLHVDGHKPPLAQQQQAQQQQASRAAPGTHQAALPCQVLQRQRRQRQQAWLQLRRAQLAAQLSQAPPVPPAPQRVRPRKRKSRPQHSWPDASQPPWWQQPEEVTSPQRAQRASSGSPDWLGSGVDSGDSVTPGTEAPAARTPGMDSDTTSTQQDTAARDSGWSGAVSTGVGGRGGTGPRGSREQAAAAAVGLMLVAAGARPRPPQRPRRARSALGSASEAVAVALESTVVGGIHLRPRRPAMMPCRAASEPLPCLRQRELEPVGEGEGEGEGRSRGKGEDQALPPRAKRARPVSMLHSLDAEPSGGHTAKGTADAVQLPHPQHVGPVSALGTLAKEAPAAEGPSVDPVEKALVPCAVPGWQQQPHHEPERGQQAQQQQEVRYQPQLPQQQSSGEKPQCADHQMSRATPQVAATAELHGGAPAIGLPLLVPPLQQAVRMPKPSCPLLQPLQQQQQKGSDLKQQEQRVQQQKCPTSAGPCLRPGALVGFQAQASKPPSSAPITLQLLASMQQLAARLPSFTTLGMLWGQQHAMASALACAGATAYAPGSVTGQGDPMAGHGTCTALPSRMGQPPLQVRTTQPPPQELQEPAPPAPRSADQRLPWSAWPQGGLSMLQQPPLGVSQAHPQPAALTLCFAGGQLVLPLQQQQQSLGCLSVPQLGPQPPNQQWQEQARISELPGVGSSPKGAPPHADPDPVTAASGPALDLPNGASGQKPGEGLAVASDAGAVVPGSPQSGPEALLAWLLRSTGELASGAQPQS